MLKFLKKTGSITLLIAIIFFTNCANYSKNKRNTKPTLIEGVWAYTPDNDALFSIERNAIYYPSHPDEKVYYTFKSDTLKIIYKGFIKKNKVLKLDNDSLVFLTEIGHINRLYRRK